MFEHYIEKDLQRYLKIINTLWENDYVTSASLATMIKVSPMTIISDVKSINLNYCENKEVLIESSGKGYYISRKSSRNKKSYLQKIFVSSLFLKSLVFFLKNGFFKMTRLEREEYISPTKAYMLKKKVEHYLQHLNIVREGKFEEYSEYKIRFLLAFIQWELGLEVVSISKENRKDYSEFLKKVEKVEGGIFSEASLDYAMILLQIGLERRMKYYLSFEEVYRTIMIETEMYKRLGKTIRNFLEKMIRFDIKESEEIYITLIINVMNVNYREGDTEVYDSYVRCIESSNNLNYQCLIKNFEAAFKISLKNNKIFQSAMISFLRKCMFNLQILIPEEHMSLGLTANLPGDMVEQVSAVLKSWNDDIKLDLTFSKAHIIQLTTKFFFVLREKEKRPNKIFLLSSFYSDYLLAKEILTKEFGALVDICQFNAQNAAYKKNDIILYDFSHRSLTPISCKKVKINYIFDIQELQKIRELLFQYDLKGIEELGPKNVK